MMGRAEKRHSLWKQAVERPWDYSFYGLVRLNDKELMHLPRTGESVHPQQEAIRFHQMPSFVFAPRELAQVQIKQGVPILYLYGAGILGPSGALPEHFTEMVREAMVNRNDFTLDNFLSMFQHRYYTFLYRAWAQSQAAVQLDRLEDHRFTNYFARLAGLDVQQLQHGTLATHVKIASIPYLVPAPRSLSGLRTCLKQFFQVPVAIEEFVLQWLRVEELDRTYLGKAQTSSYLGVGALLGPEVPDCQSKFLIRLGPMSLADYKCFTPKGSNFQALVEFVRLFFGFEMQWDIELTALASEAHPAQLGQPDALGWSTWLGEDPTRLFAVGMVYEPETYIEKGVKNDDYACR